MDDEPQQVDSSPSAPVQCSGWVPQGAKTVTGGVGCDADAASFSTDHLIESAVARILDAFESKLAYDASKQVQIDRLHEEVLQHRSNHLVRSARPLVHGLIRLHDDMGKLLTIWRAKPSGELSPARVFSMLEGLQEDIEIVLGQNGVVTYRSDSKAFDPRLQRVLKVVATEDATLAGTVAEKLRPGFEQGNEILEKERVAFFELAATAAPAPAPDFAPASPPVAEPTDLPSTRAATPTQES